MPILLLVIGAVFLIAGVRGKQSELFALLSADFSGSDNFLVWLLAFAFIGGVSMIPGFKAVANAMLALVIIVIVLAQSKNSGQSGGFIVELEKALEDAQAATANSSSSTTGSVVPLGQSTSTLGASLVTGSPVNESQLMLSGTAF